jgi:hypothetical protein
MNRDNLIRELEAQLHSVNQAIAALSGGRARPGSSAWRNKISAGMKRRWASGRSAAWRRSISLGMKRKWAARKAAERKKTA